MMWKLDPNVEEARKRPSWPRFHSACGEQKLFFDHIERAGRGYRAVAFTLRATRCGGWAGVFLAEGLAGQVIDALRIAYKKSGIDVPEATALLDAELREPITAAPKPDDAGDFDALLEDEFEGLL